MVIFHVHYCVKERVIKSSTVHPSKNTADMKPLEITIIPPSGFRSLFLHLSAITPCGSVQLRSFTGWFCLAVQKWVCLKFSIYSTEIRFPAFEDIMSQNSWDDIMSAKRRGGFGKLPLKINNETNLFSWRFGDQLLEINSSITILAAGVF